MALLTENGYHRIEHVTVDSTDLSGSVKVAAYADLQGFYDCKPLGSTSYPIQWLRDANYIADAYDSLLLHPDFVGGTLDEEELPDSGGVLLLPTRPSAYHVVDHTTSTWVVYLAVLKLAANTRINTARDQAERGGFPAFGKMFDSDSLSVQRINTAVQTANVVGESFSIDWTCADNSSITLDAAQMQALPAFLAQYADTFHTKAKGLKATITAATTLEEIEAVVW